MGKELIIEFETQSIPSVNSTYVRTLDRVVKTKETEYYQRALGFIALSAVAKQKISFMSGKIQVSIDFFVNNVNRDLDNMIKSTLDGLQGIAFKNDSQIFKIVCLKNKSKAKNTEKVIIKINGLD
ncbi:RusA family crossover junction endodeoxyribonuclease [Helicobacter sp. MIT 05-5294]|uniref:RusA family crossover junction endodeoxyribonuclease n=1 Tax=Helicobacter sp. MIT 05-5294 TaxID=1548150 RepID=UPI00051F9592|nr:RusA family crossover junction endodeoxyribonuclease [Helicobacter sp. MIT 05-5294]TLD85802.1 RusA family crossover junction endodeoxyribonuclease [Helicobacter sp. MIT 05-5294]